jgi:hypothetical protein
MPTGAQQRNGAGCTFHSRRAALAFSVLRASGRSSCKELTILAAVLARRIGRSYLVDRRAFLRLRNACQMRKVRER